ncbi:hypothetical protein D3C71_1531200 [compost metagenome]
MNEPSGVKTRPAGSGPCTTNVAPAGMLSLLATLLLSDCPACTVKASFCGVGVTMTVTVAVSQLLGAAASQIW